MWNLFAYHVFTAERQREALRDAAQFRLARAAEEGWRVNDTRSGSPDAGLGEAAPCGPSCARSAGAPGGRSRRGTRMGARTKRSSLRRRGSAGWTRGPRS